jgi:hypothetical protein
MHGMVGEPRRAGTALSAVAEAGRGNHRRPHQEAVRLLFASEVATYICERVWHASQAPRQRRDGALEFRLQTSSRKELTR